MKNEPFHVIARPLTLSELQTDAHALAVEKGWWETGRGVPECLALIHEEVSEALHEWRDGRALNEIRYSANGKPEGFPIELADAMIRIGDLAHALHISLTDAVRVKHAYNATRPHRHGGKKG